MQNLSKTVVALMGCVVIAGCADQPEEFIVDGPRNAAFNRDLAECKQLSLQKEKGNSGAIGGAVIGGLIGGVDSSEPLEGAIAGAVVGGLLGSAEDLADLDDAQRDIVFNCMRGRGHKIVG